MYEGWTAITWVLYIGCLLAISFGIPLIGGYFMGTFTDYPPFRKGANWRGKQKPMPFKMPDPWLSRSTWARKNGKSTFYGWLDEYTTLADLEKKDGVPTGAYRRSDHNPGEFPRGYMFDRLVSIGTELPKDKGMYLTTNGDQHKCQTPKFEWTRGANLKNVWMCPCGKRYRLKAYRGKSVQDGYYGGLYISLPRYKTVADTDKPLSLLDILKIGNQKYHKVSVSTGGDGKVMSHEEVINDNVVFTWERITRKPKKEKNND